MSPSRIVPCSRTLASVLLLLLVLLNAIDTGKCQDGCTQGFPDINSAEQISASITRQFVVPEYTFQCSAVITAWEAIVHIEKLSSTVQFQVWRRNSSQAGYHLVGSNTFQRKHVASDMQKEIKYIYIVQDPQPYLHVRPGDIVGVFANGLNVHYESDDDTNVDVYSANMDTPLGGLFTPLNLDPAFNRKFRGMPLIAVQIDRNTETLGTVVIPEATWTVPGGPIESTMDSLRTVPFNTSTTLSMNTLTTSYHGGTSSWIQHKETIIGVSICGVVLVSLCLGIIVTVILFIRAQRRKRIGSVTSDGLNEVGRVCPRVSMLTFRNGGEARQTRDLLSEAGTNGVCRNHKAVLLTDDSAHFVNTDQDHSYAYINSDLVNPSADIDSKPIVRSRPPTLPPARIAVRQNPCYSSTPASSTEDLAVKLEAVDGPRVENVYDLPVFATRPRQAREYEVPIKSLPNSKSQVDKAKQHIYELTDNQYV